MLEKQGWSVPQMAGLLNRTRSSTKYHIGQTTVHRRRRVAPRPCVSAQEHDPPLTDMLHELDYKTLQELFNDPQSYNELQTYLLQEFDEYDELHQYELDEYELGTLYGEVLHVLEQERCVSKVHKCKVQ